MKRAILLAAILSLGASALQAQAVPDSSQAAGVRMGYRRPVQLRMDPFRHVLIPKWGFVISGGIVAANNGVSINDARALEAVDDVQPSHILNTANLLREGSGVEIDAQGQGGLYLGGPIGSKFAIGLTGQARAYGFALVPQEVVELLQDGNANRADFSAAGARGLTLVTAEAGAHAAIRLGPLGGEDGMHATIGFGGRLIWPQWYANATADASSQVMLSGTTAEADVGVNVLRTEDASVGTSAGSGFAADFLLRGEWPTSGLAFEVMVANVGEVTINGLLQESWSLNVASSQLLEALDSLDATDFTDVATDQNDTVKLPRIVRFTGSSWGNRILQIDLSATLAVHDEFDTPTIVNLGTTWRFLPWLPLHAGIEMNGRQGLGFTAGIGIEAANVLFRVYGGSLGGWLYDANGAAARVELGVFF